MKVSVFWILAPCSLVEIHWRFRGVCCLHHLGDHPDDGDSKVWQGNNNSYKEDEEEEVCCLYVNVRFSEFRIALYIWLFCSFIIVLGAAFVACSFLIGVTDGGKGQFFNLGIGSGSNKLLHEENPNFLRILLLFLRILLYSVLAGML
jgi:hypothetical protein